MIPTIEPHVAAATERGPADAKFISIDMPMTLNNSSERDAYVIAGIVFSFGHKARGVEEPQFFQSEADGRKANQQLIMRDLIWQDERRTLGVASVFQSFLLSREEKATQNYVHLMSADSYDILEVEAVFHIVDPCPGFYPFETCYEFASHFRFVGGVGTRENTMEGHTPDVAFYYREVGSLEWLEASEEFLRTKFDYKTVKTVRMIMLPDAPILTLTRPPAAGASD